MKNSLSIALIMLSLISCEHKSLDNTYLDRVVALSKFKGKLPFVVNDTSDVLIDYCTGVILTCKSILTARHCVQGKSQVHLRRGKDVFIGREVTIPSVESGLDLAIVTVERIEDVTEVVFPSHRSSSDYMNQHVKIVGFGLPTFHRKHLAIIETVDKDRDGKVDGLSLKPTSSRYNGSRFEPERGFNYIEDLDENYFYVKTDPNAPPESNAHATLGYSGGPMLSLSNELLGIAKSVVPYGTEVIFTDKCRISPSGQKSCYVKTEFILSIFTRVDSDLAKSFIRQNIKHCEP